MLPRSLLVQLLCHLPFIVSGGYKFPLITWLVCVNSFHVIEGGNDVARTHYDVFHFRLAETLSRILAVVLLNLDACMEAVV